MRRSSVPPPPAPTSGPRRKRTWKQADGTQKSLGMAVESEPGAQTCGHSLQSCFALDLNPFTQSQAWRVDKGPPEGQSLPWGYRRERTKCTPSLTQPANENRVRGPSSWGSVPAPRFIRRKSVRPGELSRGSLQTQNRERSSTNNDLYAHTHTDAHTCTHTFECQSKPGVKGIRTLSFQISLSRKGRQYFVGRVAFRAPPPLPPPPLYGSIYDPKVQWGL